MSDGQFHRFDEDEQGRPTVLWTLEVTHWGTGRSGIVAAQTKLLVSDGLLIGQRVELNHDVLVSLAT